MDKGGDVTEASLLTGFQEPETEEERLAQANRGSVKCSYGGGPNRLGGGGGGDPINQQMKVL